MFEESRYVVFLLQCINPQSFPFIHTNCLEEIFYFFFFSFQTQKKKKKTPRKLLWISFSKNFFMLHFHCYFNVFKYRYVVTFYIHFLILKTISYWSLRKHFLIFLIFFFLVVVVVVVPFLMDCVCLRNKKRYS